MEAEGLEGWIWTRSSGGHQERADRTHQVARRASNLTRARREGRSGKLIVEGGGIVECAVISSRQTICWKRARTRAEIGEHAIDRSCVGTLEPTACPGGARCELDPPASTPSCACFSWAPVGLPLLGQGSRPGLSQETPVREVVYGGACGVAI
jgi:hypothetical protein